MQLGISFSLPQIMHLTATFIAAIFIRITADGNNRITADGNPRKSAAGS